MKQIILILCSLFLSFTSFSQAYSKYAEFQSPNKKGFCRIQLTPEIKSSLNPTMSDIRLFDAQNKEVPYIKSALKSAKYSKSIAPVIKQLAASDKKKTVYQIQFPSPQLISKVDFQITNKNKYLRKAELATNKSGKTTLSNTPEFIVFKSFFMSSKEKKPVQFEAQKLNDFYLIIYNNDDAPLVINAAICYQKNSYIVADLNAKSTYTLRFGNKNAQAPVYDLQYFKNTIPKKLPLLIPGEITVLAKPKIKDQLATPETASISPVIWAVIIISIVALAFFSIKMLNDKKK